MNTIPGPCQGPTLQHGSPMHWLTGSSSTWCCQLRWRPPSAGIRLKSSSLQTVLYLCSGGDDWHLQVPPAAAPPIAPSCSPLDPAFLEAFPEGVELRASNPAGQDPAEPMQASEDGSVGGSVQEPEPPERPLIPTLGQEAAPVQVGARRNILFCCTCLLIPGCALLSDEEFATPADEQPSWSLGWVYGCYLSKWL